MTTLTQLTPAGKKRKRVGRGGARGGTSGKGHKGQKARSGPQIGAAFEGGQMPLTRRLPKRGFNNARFRVEYEVINVGTLNERFEAGSTVDKDAMVTAGLIKGSSRRVKILGHGALTKSLIVYAEALSKTAADAITNNGGQVHIVSKAVDGESAKSRSAKGGMKEK